jgi:xanthine dehydrogenase YagT iron-sulfur-binding subunit
MRRAGVQMRSDYSDYSRREVLAMGGLTLASALPLAADAADAAVTEPAAAPPPHPAAPVMAAVTFQVNGRKQSLNLDTRTSLLDALREHLQITGPKKGCDQGQCGACTVLVNGQRMVSCLSLAVMHEGDQITTIEGLGTPEKLHPLQAAFLKHDGFQCGYCTPGQVCSAVAVLEEIEAGVPSHVTRDLTAAPKLSDSELRERMSGNLCRCAAYSNIIDAIGEVAGIATLPTETRA